MSPRTAINGGFADARSHPSSVRTDSGSPTDAISIINGIGNVELFIDSIAGMTHNGTNVTSLTDQSSNARAITLVTAPLGSNTQWNGSQKGMRFTSGGAHQISFQMPATAQPLSAIMVIGNVSAPGIITSPFITNTAFLRMSLTAAGVFASYASVEYDSAFNVGNSTRFVWICTYNGASSVICRSGTEEAAATIGGSGLSVGTQFISQTNLTADIAAFVLYSKALTAPQRALVVSTFVARYSGCTLV